MRAGFSLTRRQLLAGAGAAAASAGLAASGVARAVEANASGNLVVLASGDQLVYLEYLKGEFLKEFPNVNVELQTVGYDQLYTRISTIMASGSDAADVLEMDVVWTADFARNNWAMPLDDYITADERTQLQANLLAPYQSQGALVGLPVGSMFKTMFYNTEQLAALGLSEAPTTYEDLAEIGGKVRGQGGGKYVQGFGWSQSEGLVCDWTSTLHAFGGAWFKDGQWAFNDDAGVAALTFMVDNLANDVLDPASITFNDRTVMNPFLAGDYLAMLSWGLWGWGLANDANESRVVGKVGVGLNYGSRAAGIKSATCSGGGANVVNPNSRNRDFAVEWVRRASGINRVENQEFLLRQTGSLPVLEALWDGPKLEEINPAAKLLAEQSKYVVNRPGNHVIGYQAWSQILQVELTSALTRQKSAKQALDDAVSQSNASFQPFGL